MGMYFGLDDLLYTARTVTIIAVILSVISTVLAFIFLVPEKKRAQLNKFGKFIHDTLNFRYLIIEKILQTLYIFLTAFMILFGFCLLFVSVYGQWLGGTGILLMILGPIAVRLVYEGLMMAILVVKNVIGINNKLKNQNEGEASGSPFTKPDFSEYMPTIPAPAPAPAPAPDPAPAPAPVQNTAEDTVYCPNCGAAVTSGLFCSKCGTKVR